MDIASMPWYVKAFIAIGGAGLVLKLLKGQIKPAVKSALVFLMHKFPAFRAFMIAHQADVDEMVDLVQAGMDEAVADEKKEDEQKPKAP